MKYSFRAAVHIGVALLLVVGLSIFLFSFFPGPRCGSHFNGVLAPQEAAGMSREEIARELTTRWLDSHKPLLSCPSLRLHDYKITHIEIDQETGGDTFLYSLSYDVQISGRLAGSGWDAGNGSEEEGGWIRHKFQFVTVRKESDGYRIESMATGF